MRALYGMLLVVTLSFAPVARGQHASASTKAAPGSPLTQFVPNSAKIFVTVNNLRAVDEALHKAHATGLLAMVSGGNPADAPAFDLRAAIGALLGGGSNVDTRTLMRTQLAFVARSWGQLGEAVWYIRLPDARTLDVLFPPAKRRDSRISRDARLLKMQNGVFACVRDGIVAVGRNFGPDSLLRETVRVMASGHASALSQSAQYRKLATYLPSGALATAYFVRDGSVGQQVGAIAEDFFPELERVVVGMFERAGRIDFALRGTRVTPRKLEPLPTSVIERVRQLPHTTLLAAVAGVRVDEMVRVATQNAKATDTLSRYIRVLLGLRSRSAGADRPLPEIGPNVVFAWDQDFREGRHTPQLALLVESADARALAQEVSGIAQTLIELAYALDSVEREQAPAVSLGVHLGTPVAYANLQRYASGSRFAIVRLLRNVEIAWAAHDGWLILALSRDHLERIIDASVGLAPMLATVRDARPVWQHSGKRSAIAMLQAGFAADVMGQWLADASAGEPSLLTLSANLPGGGVGVVPLGVKPAGASAAGVVVVGSIVAGSPASGKLHLGDQILGIDGALLDVALPDRDLQRRWTPEEGTPVRVLRVMRDGKVFDVEISAASPPPLVPGFSQDATSAVRELIEVGQTVPFAGLSVFQTDEKHYAAMFSLRFAEEE